jgi:hypothetical protein
MLKAGKTARSRTVDRYYASLAKRPQQRTASRPYKYIQKQSEGAPDSRRQTIVSGTKRVKQEQIRAVATAAMKNLQLVESAAAAQMLPPAAFHDPFGFDVCPEPLSRRMVSPMVSRHSHYPSTLSASYIAAARDRFRGVQTDTRAPHRARLRPARSRVV